MSDATPSPGPQSGWKKYLIIVGIALGTGLLEQIITRLGLEALFEACSTSASRRLLLAKRCDAPGAVVEAIDRGLV